MLILLTVKIPSVWVSIYLCYFLLLGVGAEFYKGFYLKTYWRIILNAYLQFGQHTFWKRSEGFIEGLIGDLVGVLEVVLLEYL